MWGLGWEVEGGHQREGGGKAGGGRRAARSGTCGWGKGLLYQLPVCPALYKIGLKYLMPRG